MAIQVWYHGKCDDGFGAAWAAHKFFEKNKHIGPIQYVPCYYGKPTPTYTSNDFIYIVDFSYPADILDRIASQVKNIQILDHHKTAEEDLKGRKDCIFDMNRSGAVITWNYFHQTPVPMLLRYVQDNDLWRHELHHSKAIVRFIRTVAHDFRRWDELNLLFETDFNGILQAAQAVEKYFQNQLEFNISHAKLVEFFGHKAPIINCNTTFTSEMCHALHEKYNTDIALSYFINSDGHVIFSLRSKGNVDVSALAKKFGGGGHHNAAGFKSELSYLHALIIT